MYNYKNTQFFVTLINYAFTNIIEIFRKNICTILNFLLGSYFILNNSINISL